MINKTFLVLNLFFILICAPAYKVHASGGTDSKTISVSVRIPPAIKTTLTPTNGPDGQAGYSMCIAGRGVNLYSLHVNDPAADIQLRETPSSALRELRSGRYSQAGAVHSTSLNNCKSKGVLITHQQPSNKKASERAGTLIVVAE